MAYDYRHIENGHAIHVIGRQLTVDGQTFTCPVGAFSPRVSPIRGWVAFAAQEPGELDGVPFDGGAILTCNSGQFAVAYGRAALGRQPCAWGPDDRLHVLVASNGANLTDVLAIAPDGSTHTYQIAKWASEGIWKIRNDGSLLLANENTHRVVNGRNLWNWDEDELTGAIGGKTDAGHPQFGCAAITFDSGGTWQHWVPSTDLQESVYVSGREMAITGFDTPEPSSVASWPVLAAAVSVPPVPVPVPVPVPRPVPPAKAAPRLAALPVKDHTSELLARLPTVPLDVQPPPAVPPSQPKVAAPPITISDLAKKALWDWLRGR